jgi:hypothetical protein
VEIMQTSMLRLAVVVVTCAVLPANAADPNPGVPADRVTVLYRGKTHTLTGKAAATIRTAALDLLKSSCEETPGGEDNVGVQERYRRAKTHSHVLITFVKPVDVPRAGNNKTPVRVESLLVPFSPDLDPETVYVLPGKRGERGFTQFTSDPCDAIREALVEASIYPVDGK